MSTPPAPSAAQHANERLAQTRRALLRHMHAEAPSREHGAPHPDETDAMEDRDGAWPQEPRGEQTSDGSPWQHVKQTASTWWHGHPARLAVEVAQPLFERYARAHPLRVLALSAATGAALVLARPWRLISVTGLLVAAVKSTQVSAFAASMLRPRSSEPFRRHEAERERETERERWQQAQAAARSREQAP